MPFRMIYCKGCGLLVDPLSLISNEGYLIEKCPECGYREVEPDDM